MSTDKTFVVAFQGETGAYSEQAALELLGNSDQFSTKGFDSFEKCFRAVEAGEARFALLPIENSLGGTIHANYDLQLRHDFFIVAEYELRVRHCLMVSPGVKAAEIEKVLSHPQALAQCDGYLRGRNLVGESSYDTAGSAKMIAENRDNRLGKCAAIASALAAERYGLEVIDSGIEDDDNNFTRFLLLSRRWLPLQHGPSRGVSSSGTWKTTMVFSLVNYQGVLVKALSAFSFRDISLTKLESRPNKLKLRGRNLIIGGPMDVQQIPFQDRELLERLKFPELDSLESNREDGVATQDDPRFQAVFYVDCVGSLADPNLQNALRHLSELASYLRILGCYPSGGVLNDYVASAVQVPHGTIVSQFSAPKSAPFTLDTPMPMPSEGKLRIGIVGFGNFGQFLAKTFTKYHNIFACSRSDYSELAAEMRVGFSSTVEEMFSQSGGLDCLVLSVSILSFESVLRRIPSDLLKGVLVVDVLSVKTLPKSVMHVLLPESADILCTHPMFGPESGKFSWRGLPCVYEKVRMNRSTFVESDRRCERFLDIFRKAGCRMVEMSCEMHDEAAAGSQFVTHFTGRVLGQLNLRSTPINTKGFETLLALVENTCKDSFDLFQALYKCNPHSSEQLLAIKQAVSSITEQLQRTSTSDVLLSDFVGRISPSKTSETHARALELKRQGKDVITTLTVGEPDFPPPQPILDAVIDAAKTGQTRYTAVGGTFELKQAISEDYSRRKNVHYDAQSEILVTHGGKQAIFCAVMALCQEGDEIVIPAPYWVSYFDIASLSGAKPVVLPRKAEQGYILSPEELETVLTENTKMFILCNPCNPTGATYSKEQLEALAAVLRKPEYSRVLVLSDEIYERLVYDGMEHFSFASLEGMQDRTILVNGFAKGYAMTGFRLGYLACKNRAIVQAGLKLQSQLNSCPSSISQYAGVAALTKVDESVLAPLYRQLEEKRNYMVGALAEIPHIVCPVPQGAFYVFPDVSHYLAKGTVSKASGRSVENATSLCNYLIEEHGLALPPGDAFGAPYGVRFSYATSMDDIKAAVERFRAGLEGLSVGL